MISSLKSSCASFFPLLATAISSSFVILVILLILGFAEFLFNRFINFILPNLGFDISPYLKFQSAVIFIKLYQNQMLVWVIVVVESTWGLTPLKRSKILIKGLRDRILNVNMIISFCIIYLSFVLTYVNFWMACKDLASGQINNNNNDDGKKLGTYKVLQVVFMAASLAFLTLYNMASMTVLYVQCRADHGEVALKIVEKEFDDSKVLKHE